MQFASLGSGSRGNGTLIEHETTCVLVDNGFSVVDLERRLSRLGRCLDDLSAVLVTHEHSDHVRGVAVLARRTKIPVWMTTGTAAACEQESFADLRLFNCHQAFAVDSLEVQPFPVPHDAREPAQFVFTEGSRRLGLLTDVGRSTPHIEAMLTACDALLLECNHDVEMLANGRYPSSLKQRVSGDHGHLSNDQAADLLSRLDCSRLQHIVAAHLSEDNNTPDHARAALSAVLDCTMDWVAVCDQKDGLPWRRLE